MTTNHNSNQLPDQIQILKKEIELLRGKLAAGKRDEEIFQVIFNSIKEGYFEFNHKGDLIYFSPNVCEITGYSADELIGKNYRAFTSVESAKNIFQRFNHVFMTGEPAEITDYEITRKDGDVVYLETSVYLMRDSNGNPVGFRGVFRDMTDQKKTEIALHESEERFRCLHEASFGGIGIHDKGKILECNKGLTDITGFAYDELIGRDGLLLIAPEWREKVMENILSDYEKLYYAEGIRKDGSRYPLEIQGKVILYQGRKARVTEFRDITERRLAEQELSKLAAVVQYASELVNIATLDGKMIFLNKAGAQMLGIDAEEIEQLNIIQAVPEHLREKVQTQLFPVLLEGGTWKGDLQYLNLKTGELTDVYANTFTIKDPATDKPQYLANVSLDITERKAAEEALIRSQDQYREVVENANDAIIILQNGMIVFHNTRAETLTGYSEEELVKTPFTDFVIPDERDAILERYEIKLNGGKFGSAYSFGILDKKGNEIRVEVNTVVISWKGKPAIQCFIRDVTLQKKLEAQLHQAYKLEAIGTLAGGIAHDFNNIIGIILGNAELAMYDVPDWSPARKNLETVRDACFRARDVVRQILSFSRLTEQERKPIIIGEVIKESLKLLRASLPTTIDIRQHIPSSTDAIQADPAQIHQVIINLCTNAAYAMKEKGGVIEASLEETILDENSARQYPDLSPGKYMRLTVSDTGEGIDPKILGRIFDPYFTTKKIGEGSGMGLAIVHGIVKNHGGAITVYSEPGKGTTFRILLPKIETKPAPQTETSEQPPKGKEKILYVDDETFLAEIGQQMLEYLGYQVESKTNPAEALEMFKAHPYDFDLVITDMAMPQMTGKMLAQELIRIRPDIPVILNSGYSDQMDEEKAKELGISAYIMKPLNTMNLAKIIRSVLDK